jgi:hypothetical protein
MKKCNIFVCLQDTHSPELSVMGVDQGTWQRMRDVASIKAPWAKDGTDPVRVEVTAAALSKQPLVPKQQCFFGWPNTYARASVVPMTLQEQHQQQQHDSTSSPEPADETSSHPSSPTHASGWGLMADVTSAGGCVFEFSSPANLFALLRKKIAGRVRAMYVTSCNCLFSNYFI